MIIEYAPEGGEPQMLDAGRMRTSEVQKIEKTADMSWAEIQDGLRGGDVTAMRTVAFVIMQRANPELRLGQFDPFEDELRIRLDTAEVREYAVRIFAEYGDEPGELAEAWAELRGVAVDKEAAEVAIKDAEAPRPPAPAPVPEALPPETASGSPTAA